MNSCSVLSPIFVVVCAILIISNADDITLPEEIQQQLKNKIRGKDETPGCESLCKRGLDDARQGDVDENDCEFKVGCIRKIHTSDERRFPPWTVPTKPPGHFNEPTIFSRQKKHTTAAHQKTEEILQNQMMNMRCPESEWPSKITPFYSSPTGLMPVLAVPTEVQCVPISGEKIQAEPSVRMGDLLYREMLQKECETVERAALSTPYCPGSAAGIQYCPPTEILCLPDTWSPIPSDTEREYTSIEDEEMEDYTSIQTPQQDDVDAQIARLRCGPDQMPSKIIPFVPDVAPDFVYIIDPEWPHSEIQCVQRLKNTGREPLKKTNEQLYEEMKHKECIFGERPAIIIPLCDNATAAVNCPPTTVVCVNDVWRDEDFEKHLIERIPRRSLKTTEQIQNETLFHCCQPASSPYIISPLCRPNEMDQVHCPPPVVGCVKKQMSTVQEKKPTNRSVQQTIEYDMHYKNLDKMMENKRCIFGQRPMKVSSILESCPDDVCPPPEIWCVKESFGYDLVSRGPILLGPHASPETLELFEFRLRTETYSMICPRWHTPTLIRGLTPRQACRPNVKIGLLDPTQR